MSKKLIAACMALAAFVAFAVMPAAASASPVLTQPTTEKMTAGTRIEATSVEIKPVFTSGGIAVVTCDTATLTGSIFENSGTSIKGTISTADFHNTGGGACSSTFGGATTVTTNVTNGVPWCIQNTKEDNWEVRGGSCGEASRSIAFALDTATVGICRYNSTVNPTGTFVTDTAGSDAILRASKSGSFKGEATNSPFCPGEGNLDMNFTLETDPEAPATAQPIYIS